MNQELKDATEGFNLLFNDKIDLSTEELSRHDNAFGRTGLGIILFLQAALGMEDGMMERAQNELFAAEKAAESAKKDSNKLKGKSSRFGSTVPYELLIASTVIGQAMTQILTESAVEMLKAIYKLNRSYKLYNNTFVSVFPGGAASLPDTPMASPAMSRQQSSQSLNSINKQQEQPIQKGFFAKKFGSFLGVNSSAASSSSSLSSTSTPAPPSDNVEEFVMSGACFGFGLFGLVFSLMPPKLKRLINVFGFKSDRKEALKALALSASYRDVHSSFAALSLLFYTSSTLLLAGWNADSEHDMRMFENILKSCEKRHPDGTLWTLNRARLERINGRADNAINILGATLQKDGGFPQAEVIIVFEYAWLLLAENKYKESAKYFLHLMKLNSWSHATYTLLAAGCYLSDSRDGNEESREKAQEEFMKMPELLNAKKLGGRNMPMEDFAQRKLAFWKRKHERRVEAYKKLSIEVDPERWDLAIKISPADEMACFWNSYGRITKEAALKHMSALCKLTPAPEIPTHLIDLEPKGDDDEIDDLDTPDEIAVRYLLLGILHRAIGELDLSRRYLDECVSYRGKATDDTWAPAFAAYELAVLELNVGDQQTSSETPNAKSIWKNAIGASEKHLALVASGEFGPTYDLEGRQGTRCYLLKDEIQTKKTQLGI